MQGSNHNKFKDTDQIALLFKQVFGSEDGEQVLYVLRQKFEKPSIIPHQVADGSAMQYLTAVRAGEINVVRYIDTMINRKLGDGNVRRNNADD